MNKTTLALALASALPASAVSLNADGVGQALIYPYYTVQSSGGDAFNTYVSVVNHTSEAKALRVRFREGRLGKETLSLNLYLSPNDVWTGAVVPFSGSARLVSVDRSCTEPRFAQDFAPGELPFIDFRNDAFSGANDDGAGTGLDRTREGFVEIIEMGTLTGASAAAATHNSAGFPANCGALLSGTPSVAAPGGGLSGSLTLINVANGLDFNVNAEALDQLAQRPFFRAASDPYPAFDAAEIDPVSVVTANGSIYRSTWNRPVDAVSAVLMRERFMGEYVLDTPTASLTDFVMALPTRPYYATSTTVTAPFTVPAHWSADCLGPGARQIGEPMSYLFWNRDELGATASGCGSLGCGDIGISTCATSSVFSVLNIALPHIPAGTVPRSAVLGSATLGAPAHQAGAVLLVADQRFQNGWLAGVPDAGQSMTSGAASTRIDSGAGSPVAGAHTFRGLPMVGFTVRTLRNGTLRCDAGACQGNYGGAFPLKYRRDISPAN
ncbi:MAG: hypothetical protein ACM3SO_16360 [Betaproteobacteria bacterium]